MTTGDGTVRRAAFSLGANLGDRLAALQAAVDTLAGAPGVDLVAVSPVYETDPVGGPEQPAYLNAVVVADVTVDAPALLAAAHTAERALGRTREVRWGPRTLDVDVLAVGDEVRDDPALTLPHPRAHERGFVLVPWAAADPDAVLPGHGRVADLAAAVGADGVRTRPDLRLTPPPRAASSPSDSSASGGLWWKSIDRLPPQPSTRADGGGRGGAHRVER
ncbi:MAG: 2-amino-4-hydroxy-6-hydroxymethyldihydropteridine diphosphokinase [Candidatus Nanopelagicales bacterium]